MTKNVRMVFLLYAEAYKKANPGNVVVDFFQYQSPALYHIKTTSSDELYGPFTIEQLEQMTRCLNDQARRAANNEEHP